MESKEYLELRKELASGQERKRSRAYPVLIGAFALMILVNAGMLVLNNL